MQVKGKPEAMTEMTFGAFSAGGGKSGIIVAGTVIPGMIQHRMTQFKVTALEKPRQALNVTEDSGSLRLWSV